MPYSNVLYISNSFCPKLAISEIKWRRGAKAHQRYQFCIDSLSYKAHLGTGVRLKQ